MPDNPNLINENELPENAEFVENAPIIPGQGPAPAPPAANKMPQFFSGSMPPVLQHDGSFVGTELGTPGIPRHSLMPLGLQAQPFTNAAIESTATKTTPGTGTAAPDVEVINLNNQTGTLYTAQLSDRDTLITLNNPAGGILTLPNPGAGTAGGPFGFVQFVHIEYGFPTSPATIVSPSITFTAGNTAVVVFRYGTHNTGVATLVDTLGNVYTPLVDAGTIRLHSANTSYFGGTGECLEIWYCVGVKGGTTQLSGVINGGANTYADMYVMEYAGISGAPIGYGTNSFPGFSSTPFSVTTIAFGGGSRNILIGIISADQNVVTATSLTSRFSIAGFYTVGDQPSHAAGGELMSESLSGTANVEGVAVVFPASSGSPGGSSGFPYGWYTYIENIGTAPWTIQSTANIDGIAQTITLNPNQGLIVVTDGTNYFTERGIGGNGNTVGGVLAKTANYTIQAADVGRLISFNISGAGTATLPATPPAPNWLVFIENTGTSSLAISPNGLNLDGSSSNLTLAPNQGVIIFTDGTNYFSERGIGVALPVSVPNGGTGDTTLAAHGVLIGEGTSPVNVTSPGTAGQVLTSNGASADPTFQNLPTDTDFYQTVQKAGVDQPQEAKLNFLAPITVTDDPGHSRTNIGLDSTVLIASMLINGVGVSKDKQVWINAVLDGGAPVWTILINGTGDGG